MASARRAAFEADRNSGRLKHTAVSLCVFICEHKCALHYFILSVHMAMGVCICS